MCIIPDKKRFYGLLFSEQGFPKINTVSAKGSRRKRVIMASGIGTNISVIHGDLLRIGMLPGFISCF